jgi:hypothetical protein
VSPARAGAIIIITNKLSHINIRNIVISATYKELFQDLQPFSIGPEIHKSLSEKTIPRH